MKDSCETADVKGRGRLARAGGAAVAVAALAFSLGVATGSASATASACPHVTSSVASAASGCVAQPMNVRWQ